MGIIEDRLAALMAEQAKTYRQPVDEAEKLAAYRAGQYVFEVPPVYTGNWTEADWIRSIAEGNWRIPTGYVAPTHG